MISFAKWAPLKLTIIALPHSVPSVSEGDHTPNGSPTTTCDRSLWPAAGQFYPARWPAGSAGFDPVSHQVGARAQPRGQPGARGAGAGEHQAGLGSLGCDGGIGTGHLGCLGGGQG